MYHIVESEILTSLDHKLLVKQVMELTKTYQKQGLVVEIQYSTTNHSSLHLIAHSAFVIGRLKGVTY